jgi:hypothetical protein
VESNSLSVSEETLRIAVHRYRASRKLDTIDPEIGCIVHTDSFFLGERDWTDAPQRWSNDIVHVKG